MLIFYCRGETRDKLGRNNRRQLVVEPARCPWGGGVQSTHPGERGLPLPLPPPRSLARSPGKGAPPWAGKGGSPSSALSLVAAKIPAEKGGGGIKTPQRKAS